MEGQVCARQNRRSTHTIPLPKGLKIKGIFDFGVESMGENERKAREMGKYTREFNMKERQQCRIYDMATCSASTRWTKKRFWASLLHASNAASKWALSPDETALFK
jgi:hypothetical protein